MDASIRNGFVVDVDDEPTAEENVELARAMLREQLAERGR